MYRIKKNNIYASEISEYSNLNLKGNDFIVNNISSSKCLLDNSILFVDIENNDDILERIKNKKNILFFTSREFNDLPQNVSVIISNNAKIDFINLVKNFFIEVDQIKIAKSSIIHKDAILGKNISIGEHCVIGGGVSIADNTIIQNNIVISGCVSIGENCIIKNNATIGSEGFNFVKDKDGIPVHAPQIGRIYIGNHVWVGSNTCIESAYIDDTIIEDEVKIDDLVQIGYNCLISKNTMITAGVILSNNVIIKHSAFIGLNSCIKENITIGRNSLIGMGSVVITDVENNSVYMGNPAKFLRNTKKGEI